MPFIFGSDRRFAWWKRADGPSRSGRTGGPRSLLTRIEDYRIHAIEIGDADQVLVLVHGLAGSGRWWSRNVEAFSTKWRVIVPDLIGFGRSVTRAPQPEPARVARLLLDWATEIGIENFSLVGHSMGGQLCVHLTAAAPDRVDRLVLVDAAGIPRDLDPRAITRFAAEIAPIWRWGDPRFLPTIAGDALTAGPRTLISAIRHILVDDIRPLLPKIPVPTLIIWGERDRLVPLADAVELRQSLPDARLVVLRGAAHNPMVDRPAAFNRLVLEFLDGEPVGR